MAASFDNIRWKTSGLGMGDNNWPVDWLWSTYDDLMDAYTEIISGFSGDEQTALVSKNAQELYRI